MILNTKEHSYRVRERVVAETAQYRLYVCEDTSSNEALFLQVATALEFNGELQRAAFVLGQLRKRAEEREADHVKKLEREGADTGKRLHYELLIPEVVEGFASAEHDNRQMVILRVADLKKGIEAMLPMSMLTEVDGKRLSPMSSAWVIGRLLKLLLFVHTEGYAGMAVDGDNVLLEPEWHRVTPIDWSAVKDYRDGMTPEVTKLDIVSAASAVFTAIGGDTDDGEYPYDVEDAGEYIDFLRRLMRGREADANAAHIKLYQIVRATWGHGYRPTEILPL